MSNQKKTHTFQVIKGHGGVWIRHSDGQVETDQATIDGLEVCDCCCTPDCVKWLSHVVFLDNSFTRFTESMVLEVELSDGTTVEVSIDPTADWTTQVEEMAAKLAEAFPSCDVEPRCNRPDGCGNLNAPPSDAQPSKKIIARYVSMVCCPTSPSPVRVSVIDSSNEDRIGQELYLESIKTPEKRGWVCVDCGKTPTLYDSNMVEVPEADIPACLFDCAELIPELPSLKCTTELIPVCDSGNVNQTVFATFQDCGDGTILVGYWTPDADGGLTEYDIVGEVQGEGCTECELIGVETKCDESTCDRVDFLVYSNCVKEGPFISGTTLPYTAGKGPYVDCKPKNVIKTECVEISSYAYSWDNGSFSNPFTGEVLAPRGSAAPSNGYTSNYDTPGGTVISFNGGAINSYVGFIDRKLTCGTATIDNIIVGGSNILPAPVVDTTTVGTWGGLNKLLWDTITAITGESFPSGTACHNNRPEIKPVNCWGQSVSCADIDLESFQVTDCDGNVWVFGFKKVVLDSKRYTRMMFEDCAGRIICEYIDDTTKLVIEEIDEACVELCVEPSVLDQVKVVCGSGDQMEGNYEGAIAITRGRPDNTAQWNLVDNRDPLNQVIVATGNTFQEFSADLAAKGFSEWIEGEIHYVCPCPVGLEAAGDYFVEADGQTVTKPACTPLTELPNAPEKAAASEEECALRVTGCNDDRRDELLGMLAETVSECCGGESASYSNSNNETDFDISVNENSIKIGAANDDPDGDDTIVENLIESCLADGGSVDIAWETTGGSTGSGTITSQDTAFSTGQFNGQGNFVWDDIDGQAGKLASLEVSCHSGECDPALRTTGCYDDRRDSLLESILEKLEEPPCVCKEVNVKYPDTKGGCLKALLWIDPLTQQPKALTLIDGTDVLAILDDCGIEREFVNDCCCECDQQIETPDCPTIHTDTDPTYTNDVVRRTNGDANNVTLHEAGDVVEFPLVAGPNALYDFTHCIYMDQSCCLLALDPETPITIRVTFDHVIVGNATHTGFNINPGPGTIVASSPTNTTSATIGGDIGLRADRWVDIEFRLGDMLSGDACYSTGALGTSNSLSTPYVEFPDDVREEIYSHNVSISPDFLTQFTDILTACPCDPNARTGRQVADDFKLVATPVGTRIAGGSPAGTQPAVIRERMDKLGTVYGKNIEKRVLESKAFRVISKAVKKVKEEGDVKK